MEEAIAAGVSSYNVVDTAFPDVKPIVMAAVAIFRNLAFIINGTIEESGFDRRNRRAAMPAPGIAP